MCFQKEAQEQVKDVGPMNGGSDVDSGHGNGNPSDVSNIFDHRTGLAYYIRNVSGSNRMFILKEF